MTDKNSDETTNVQKVFDVGVDIAGSVGGAVIGSIIAGPGGIVIGGVAGPAITHMIRAATEFAQRQLSRREGARVETVMSYTVAKIEKNKALGRQVRKDDFLREQIDDRTPADEITEGVLLIAQREYQEKKLKFYGNLLGNIVFDPEVSPSLANQLLKKAEVLSYQQLCLLTIFRRRQEFPKLPQHMNINNVPRMSIREDLYDLFQHGVFDREQTALNTAVKELVIYMTQFGIDFHDLMELHEIESRDLDEIITIMGKHT